MCAAVWSSTTLGARDPGFSDGSDSTRRTRCTRENNLWYPGNLGSISAVSRVQSSMPPEKSSFERMRGGSFSKQRLLIEPIKDKRGRPNVYIQSEREKASVLFTSTVSFTLRTKSVSCARQICSFCRYILEILVPVYGALNLAAFGLSISPAHGDL